MNERERYKRAFSVLRASSLIDLEAEMKHRPNYKKKLVIVCVCAVLVLALTVSAFAVGGDTLKRILGWDSHIEIHELENEIGETIENVHYNKILEPVRIENGRMFFVVNGENTDITDMVAADEPYSYTYEDEEGYTYFYFVGPSTEGHESYAYAEFIKNPDGDWVGGHGSGFSHDDEGNAPDWLEKGKAEFNIPW